MEYIVRFKVNSTEGYYPITIACRISEVQAKLLMATPVQSISISVERAGGMVIDAMREPVIFEGDKSP